MTNVLKEEPTAGVTQKAGAGGTDEGSARKSRLGVPREAEKENPYHCAVCYTLFEPGSPGGHPANALGFPSTAAERLAHSVLGGIPVLRVLAQKKLPHHAHGRGSRYSTLPKATLTQAVPRCKPFSAPHQTRRRPVGCRRHPLTRRRLLAAITPQSRRYVSGRPVPVGEPLRPA
jgi:hypothetical protein